MTALASRTQPLAGHGASLLWTEYGYLLAVFIAMFLTVDPLNWGPSATGFAHQSPLLKHIALALTLPMVLLALAGRSVNDGPWERSPRTGQLWRELWPLAALAGLILGGGLYARLVLHIQNTFLNFGLYMLVAFAAAAMILQSGAPGRIVRWHFRILLAAAAIMSASLVVNFRVQPVYHEQIFLLIPLAVYALARPGPRLLRWAGCAFLLATAWLSAKYTSYIICAATVLYLMLAIAFPRIAAGTPVHRAAIKYWSTLAVIALAGLAVLAVLSTPESLPTGNLDFRLHTYAAAWDLFTASPLWGTLFAAEATSEFTLYDIDAAGAVLATHSDVMDLLAHGGVIGTGLWLAALARAARIAHGSLLRGDRLAHPWAAYGHTLAMLSIAAILTYFFNPILLQPPIAYMVWTNFGLLVGLSLRAREAVGQRGAPSAPRGPEVENLRFR
jgi:hypothetical protein